MKLYIRGIFFKSYDFRFVAAMNMIGNPTPVSQIPYFWTRHYDKTVQYSGIGSKYDDIIIDGDLQDMKFVAYYTLKGRVVASASSGVPQVRYILQYKKQA